MRFDPESTTARWLSLTLAAVVLFAGVAGGVVGTGVNTAAESDDESRLETTSQPSVGSSEHVLQWVSLRGAPGVVSPGSIRTRISGQQTSVTLAYPNAVFSQQNTYPTSASDVRTSGEALTVDINGSYDLTGQDGSYLTITNTSGATVRVMPTSSVTLRSGELELKLFDAEGTLLDNPALENQFGTERSSVTVTVEGATGMFLDTLDSYVVRLHRPNGEVVARTGSDPLLTGYDWILTQRGTSGDITVSLPQGDLPASTDGRLTLINVEEYGEYAVPMTLNDGKFEAVIDARTLPDGNYTWSAEFTTAEGEAPGDLLIAPLGSDFQGNPIVVNVTVDSPSQPLPAVADRYDNDENGAISITELGQAATDYANSDLTIADLGRVAAAYANS